MGVKALPLALLIFLWSWPGMCSAHDLHLTGIKMMWEPNALTVTVLTPASRLATQNYGAAIASRLKLRLNGEKFKPGKTALMLDQPNDLVMWQARYTGHVSRIELLGQLYPEDAASRIVLTIFRNGQIIQETILDASHPSLVISEQARSVPRLRSLAVFYAKASCTFSAA